MTNDSEAVPSGDAVDLIHVGEDVTLAVAGYLSARKRKEEGLADGEQEMAGHLRTIQGRYWRIVFAALQRSLAKSRRVLEFTDEERFLIDLGVIDMRLLGGDSAEMYKALAGEIHAAGPSGCHYLSEWFAERRNQLLIEDSLADSAIDAEGDYASQIVETRSRILSRLQPYFSGLPGVPAEVAQAMQSGALDDAILNLDVSLLKRDSRTHFLRRRNLWQLREQIISKARARADGQAAQKLFDLLGEIFARNWKERYDNFLRQSDRERPAVSKTISLETSSLSFTVSGQVMIEARQMRMRSALAAAMNNEPDPNAVLASRGPRLTKADLAKFLPVVRTFDRMFSEPPPVVIVPGVGRGLFAWEIGCVVISLCPLAGREDSIATAFAHYRMHDDRRHRGGALEKEYEARFPGSSFHNEFPVDYRAWLCRLTRGDMAAMGAERRAFFRELIGPDISGPIVPPNFQNLSPQTLGIVCLRLEKQLAAGESDANLLRRLGTLHWQQGNMAAAALQLTSALQADPNDGASMFIMGMFLRAQGDLKSADALFRQGAGRAAGSMWGVYCRDALDKQF